jgi:hypothetical protein
MKRKGRNAAVSLQNNEIVNAAQCKNKYLIFFFWRYSIKNKNDNKEKNDNSKSPLAGIHAIEDTKSGCAQ